MDRQESKNPDRSRVTAALSAFSHSPGELRKEMADPGAIFWVSGG